MLSSRRVTVLLVLTVLAAGCGDGTGSDPPQPEPEPAITPEPALAVAWELVAGGLDVPNDLADIGDGRLLLSDQVGRIHLLVDGELAGGEPVLDLTDRVAPPSTASSELELGLSGFAPHPEFASNGLVYVLYTMPPPDDAGPEVRRVDVLSEFTVSEVDGDAPMRADPASERVLLRLEQHGRVHVGGHLAFDPDGLLHVGLGDSGNPAEARDPATLPGSIIRFDPGAGDPYGIPPDNPFVDGGGAPEVYGYGLRNPWRVGWLDGVGLLVAEPKWTAKDQDVHVVVAGGDYGWPDLPVALPDSSCYPSPEATEPLPEATEPLPECVAGPDGQSWQPPVVEYGRGVGRIVSGVAPYRGTAIPELTGSVVVSDWEGSLLAATPTGPGEQWRTRPLDGELPDAGAGVSYLWALDADAGGEVYAMTATRTFRTGEGAVYRLVPVDA